MTCWFVESALQATAVLQYTCGVRESARCCAFAAIAITHAVVNRPRQW